MSKPTLVILAAGMASRYGSMKQTEGFGPSGETIMDYSIYDALQAGFGKIIFIIRKDFAAAFEENFNKKLEGKIKVAYVYQELNTALDGYIANTERVKPWGTGHALLCAIENIQKPFAIINADDFYGKDAFVMASNFLQNNCTASKYAIIGYELANTLSDNGTVSRGVCVVQENGDLASVTERTKVYKKDGQLVNEDEQGIIPIDNEARASMNFWCFDKSVLEICKKLFSEFLQKQGQELKSEFFLTNIGDYVIKQHIASIAVIPTSAHWFGVTYKEDAPIVKSKVNALITSKTYPTSLW
jgi:choline kinase